VFRAENRLDPHLRLLSRKCHDAGHQKVSNEG